MKSQRLFRAFLKLFAARLVEAAYAGILQRPPDAAGAEAYERQLADKYELEALLRALASSDEHWRQAFGERSGDLLSLAYRGVLGREVDAIGVQAYRDVLKRPEDFAALLGELARSDENWKQHLGDRGGKIVREAFATLLAREVDGEALAFYSAQLKDSGELGPMLEALAASHEHWQVSIDRHAEELVRVAFATLLAREPDEAALANHSAQLRKGKDIGRLIEDVASSPEFWDKLQSRRAEDFVRLAYRGILGRDPEPQALARYAQSVQAGGDAASVLRDLARSDELWQGLLQRRGDEALSAAFRALLDGSAAGAKADPQRSDTERMLTVIRDRLFKEIIQSLVRACYLAILKREPDPNGLANYVAKLRRPEDIRMLILSLLVSDEFTGQRSMSAKRRPIDAYEQPSIVFVHIQKTAGTALRRCISRSFPRETIFDEHADTLYVRSPSELAAYSVFAGHFNYDSLAFIPRKTKRLVSFVRHPQQRLLSLYNFWRAYEPDHPDYGPNIVAANQLPIEAFFARRESRNDPQLWNHMTWALIGDRQWRAWRQRLPLSGPIPAEFLETQIRPPIRARLREFEFVGLQEDFEQSVQILFRRVLGKPVPAIGRDHALELLVQTTPHFKREARRESLTPELEAAMQELTQIDRVVYDEARALYRGWFTDQPETAQVA